MAALRFVVPFERHWYVTTVRFPGNLALCSTNDAMNLLEE
jgi:hypothetical protein